VRVPFLAAVALWLAAVVLIVLSVWEGGATVSLVLIFPVVSGSSLAFLIGVGLLIAGFVALFFDFVEGSVEPEGPSSVPSSGASSGSGGAGGFVLIGPVPIVFGSWRGISRRNRWLLALVGAVLLIAVVLGAVWFWR